MLHLLLSTSSAVLRLCWFLVLLRSVVHKHSPLTMFGLELPVVPFLCSLSRKRRGAPSALSGSERIDALRYQRIKKAKKMTMNNNNSKTRKKAGVNPVPFYKVTFFKLTTSRWPQVKSFFFILIYILMICVSYKWHITCICDSINTSANRVR